MGEALSLPKTMQPSGSLNVERCEIIGLYHITEDTPSVSPFGLTAPSKRKPRVLRTRERRAAMMSRPYGYGEKGTQSKQIQHTI